eukprot:257091-Pleurochrysis_carterae.AAC.5
MLVPCAAPERPRRKDAFEVSEIAQCGKLQHRNDTRTKTDKIQSIRVQVTSRLPWEGKRNAPVYRWPTIGGNTVKSRCCPVLLPPPRARNKVPGTAHLQKSLANWRAPQLHRFAAR